MITANEKIVEMLDSPVRKIAARVELYEGSTLVDTFNYTDKLVDFTIERVSEEGKFFGFGICQHVEITLLDVSREIDYINTSHSLKIAYGVDGEYVYPHPTYYITQSRRNEKTNELTVYGYDLLFDAAKHTINEVNIEETIALIEDEPEISASYTIQDAALACAAFIGATAIDIQRVGASETSWQTNYPTGANFDGAETLREVLDMVAEATQTIYFIDNQDRLIFKRLDEDGVPDIVITKEDYFDLESKSGRRLQTIVSATELGDNVAASGTAIGSTQYVRDNAFWELREDIAVLVENAVEAIAGLTINQFDCDWRGNFLVEIGDKIGIVAKDGSVITSFLLDDTIEYNGGFQEKTKWEYDEEDEETANPSSLGEVLKQTYARVDKANKQIEIVASETDVLGSEIGSLQINTESINATVKAVETSINDNMESINESIQTLTTQVQASMTADEVNIIISEAMATGVEAVSTTTGFTFNEVGLSISRSDSEISTTITEDGMTVYRDDEIVLTADNEGVKAQDLHATTFLIIGTNSRFEDYDGGSRTGCFWIGV